MRSTLSLTAIGLIWATSSLGQGVPTVDGGLIIRNEAANIRREADLAQQAERLSTAEAIAAIEVEQLDVLQQILDAQSSFVVRTYRASCKVSKMAHCQNNRLMCCIHQRTVTPAAIKCLGMLTSILNS